MTDDQYRPQRNWGARFRDVMYRGMRLVILENDLLRLGVMAGKGTDIVELNYKPLDMDFAWLAPGGVRNPVPYAATAPDNRAAFRENYPGGWQEIFPNGGHPSTHEGAAYGQHGELFNVPWDVAVIEDTEEAVALRFTVRTRKSPCVIEKTIRLRRGTAGFRIEERLRNESPVPVRAMWGHHITFGPPFLAPGCYIRLPDGITAQPHPESVAPTGRRVSGIAPFQWPVDPGNGTDLSVIPGPGTPSDLLYMSGFPEDTGWYEVIKPGGELGLRVEWDAMQMPYLWYWQEFGGTTGYPWYGRNFNIGLEPFSSTPSLGLEEAVANGSALTLRPGEDRHFWLNATVLHAAE